MFDGNLNSIHATDLTQLATVKMQDKGSLFGPLRSTLSNRDGRSQDVFTLRMAEQERHNFTRLGPALEVSPKHCPQVRPT